MMLLLTSAGRDVIPIIFSISPPVSPPNSKKSSRDPNTLNSKYISVDHIQRRQYRTVIKGKEFGVKLPGFKFPALQLANYVIFGTLLNLCDL